MDGEGVRGERGDGEQERDIDRFVTGRFAVV